jgi:FAD synthase
VEYLREIRPFVSVQALIDQMREDVDVARAVIDAKAPIL